jgi:hypothetical protein
MSQVPSLQNLGPITPLLGIPCGRDVLPSEVFGAIHAFMTTIPNAGRRMVTISALCYAFNTLYAGALNERKNGLTHFVMLHDDVAPMDLYWGVRLLHSLTTHKLAACAAMVAIRDDEIPETSTALDDESGKNQPRRIKIGEWNGVVTSREHPNLLINTGCLAIDLRHPQAEKLYFTFKDGIKRSPDGTYSAWAMPEDWNLSRMMRSLRMDFGVDADIPTIHIGTKAFSNMPRRQPGPPPSA